MLYLKPGVDICGLKPEMCLGNQIIHTVFTEQGFNCVITSGREGIHSEKSRHYSGEALDYRTSHLPAEIINKVVNILAVQLGRDFDVIFEKDHIHVEYDPKRKGGNV